VGLFERLPARCRRHSATTANQYGHLFPETQREMAERMGRLILSEAPPAANKQ